ncbi:MAG TPA: prepilin-type N-terminal cleavage/methylation domain-containing protein [Candidatus Binatia bacterium]|jgi:prepilin-type N-terminal cleavage/methylation domain-containing protein|nr:prepilin-type N-terminal cleavage/methylation domain-containing protein [Candidatus Binatia bacterium]
MTEVKREKRKEKSFRPAFSFFLFPFFFRARPTLHGRARNAARGFTLMELLVVLTIFSTVVVSASDIFLLANKSQRKVFGLERSQADARFTIEAIAREVRNDTIDYAYYAGRATAMAVPDMELALVDSTNTKIRFETSTAATQSACADAQSRPCLLVTVGANPAVAITPKKVAVRVARFYIAPQSDPLTYDVTTASYPVNVQPHVTIVLVLESRGDRVGEQSVVYLQTTATNRGYRR